MRVGIFGVQGAGGKRGHKICGRKRTEPSECDPGTHRGACHRFRVGSQYAAESVLVIG